MQQMMASQTQLQNTLASQNNPHAAPPSAAASVGASADASEVPTIPASPTQESGASQHSAS
eukprot:14880285-Alexandrium_andersonii.AAC.1